MPTRSGSGEAKNANRDDKEMRLNTITSSFFKNQATPNWRIYPSAKLTGKYIGHQLRFFTMPASYNTQAEAFFNLLKQNGFESQLTKANDKPSIIVDLTASTLNFIYGLASFCNNKLSSGNK